jgi:uncharacterized protein DUF1059
MLDRSTSSREQELWSALWPIAAASRATATVSIRPADDVVAAAVQHAVASHGHQDTPEMRERLREMLEPESAYLPGERKPEPFPA